jgi:hypothetical protein
LCRREHHAHHHAHTFVWQPLAPDAAWRVSCFPIDVTWRQSGLQVVAMVTNDGTRHGVMHADVCLAVWCHCMGSFVGATMHHQFCKHNNNRTFLSSPPLPLHTCPRDVVKTCPVVAARPTSPPKRSSLSRTKAWVPLCSSRSPPSTRVDITERAVSCSVSSAVPRKLHVCGPSKPVACGCLRAAACSPGKVCMVKKRGDEREGSRREASADHRPLRASAFALPMHVCLPAWLVSTPSYPPSTAWH